MIVLDVKENGKVEITKEKKRGRQRREETDEDGC